MSAAIAIPIVALFLALPLASAAASAAEVPVPVGLLDPLKIPKWVNQLTGAPPTYEPTVVTDPETGEVSHEYTVEMNEFKQQILPPGFPETSVWGYGGNVKDPLTGEITFVQNSPAPSFEAVRGIPVNVKWVNNIDTTHMFPVDPTLHWANPNNMDMMDMMPPFEPYPPGYAEAQSPVPLVPHLHGSEVQSTSDGGPDAWFTWDGKHGSAYNTYRPTDPNSAVYHYPNEQLPTTLWYHDHALGITRINVMSGLAGFYLLRDPSDPLTVPGQELLPSGEYEVPLAIQDRTFKTNGELFFDSVGINPDMHPYWTPEFFGNAIMVNGMVWPNMDVDQGQYRFRLLDGSNARFYTLSFSNGMPFTVIGSDGGYLRAPATVTKLTIAPGERYDILVDFSALPAGTKVVMLNSAKAPYPSGTPPLGATTGQIIQFTVTGNAGFAPKVLPTPLNSYLPTFPSLGLPDFTRKFILQEVMGMGGPLEILLNGQKWHAMVTETPTAGSTEDWVIVNPTMDTHPIHLHLTQFQLISRQRIDAMAYEAQWLAVNGMPPFEHDYVPVEVDPTPYLKGKPKPALPAEQGWKDTVQMNPGEVTIIRVKFAPIDGSAYYPFDPTEGPGYVWHCHIIDHEDNEMMRPYYVVNASTAPKP